MAISSCLLIKLLVAAWALLLLVQLLLMMLQSDSCGAFPPYHGIINGIINKHTVLVVMQY